eukprot:GHVU01083684.1.p1 GENE.GHVU01083684.1~~GHVU01083684.1.p1  ORF type:complete len:557 (+),score=108.92 GHVU01083684.1:2068-3738(+)
MVTNEDRRATRRRTQATEYPPPAPSASDPRAPVDKEERFGRTSLGLNEFRVSFCPPRFVGASAHSKSTRHLFYMSTEDVCVIVTFLTAITYALQYRTKDLPYVSFLGSRVILGLLFMTSLICFGLVRSVKDFKVTETALRLLLVLMAIGIPIAQGYPDDPFSSLLLFCSLLTGFKVWFIATLNFIVAAVRIYISVFAYDSIEGALMMLTSVLLFCISFAVYNCLYCVATHLVIAQSWPHEYVLDFPDLLRAESGLYQPTDDVAYISSGERLLIVLGIAEVRHLRANRPQQFDLLQWLPSEGMTRFQSRKASVQLDYDDLVPHFGGYGKQELGHERNARGSPYHPSAKLLAKLQRRFCSKASVGKSAVRSYPSRYGLHNAVASRGYEDMLIKGDTLMGIRSFAVAPPQYLIARNCPYRRTSVAQSLLLGPGDQLFAEQAIATRNVFFSRLCPRSTGCCGECWHRLLRPIERQAILVPATIKAAHWQQRVIMPRYNVFKRFCDSTIERWYLCWVQPLRSRLLRQMRTQQLILHLLIDSLSAINYVRAATKPVSQSVSQ